MGTQFGVRGIARDLDQWTGFVDAHCRNAADILDRLGRPSDPPCGSALCFDMIQDCTRALTSLEAELDLGYAGRELHRNGISAKGARSADHINQLIREIRDLCERGLKEIGPLAEMHWG